ncbi:MAG: protein-(glutamine-N5) methyltransferase, release factor-specific [Candidatus Pelagibacter sp.]|nr:protein-(glutamine-N5) methyltransferase, release factor-specific [Candidatus Pelagibacter sp.]
MNYLRILNEAKKKLIDSNISTPNIDSEILLSHILKIDREKLLCNLESKIDIEQIYNFKNLLNLRQKKMPIAYIIKKKEFWKNNFFVDRSVLIPRPESEIILEKALANIKKNESKKILDIGTGSGCLIISILLERIKCKGTALDISKKAINIAKINAKIQHVENRITFVNSDIDKFYSSKYDLIISNPPYIKKHKINSLIEDVKNYEPIKALNGGVKGNEVLKIVINKSSKLLRKGGKLILEIDDTQLYLLKEMLLENKFYLNEIIKDLQGLSRCLILTKH